MLVQKNFFRPSFICPEKIFDSGEKIFIPLPQQFLEKKIKFEQGII